MATKSGKIHLHEIKVGKTFYLVQADFPIVMPGVVGNGEVEMIRKIRVTSKPFWRGLSACMAFKYVDNKGREGWVNLDEMKANHALVSLTREAPYFVVLTNHRALLRFINTFNNRPPNPAEVLRTKLREAGLNAEQRGLS